MKKLYSFVFAILSSIILTSITQVSVYAKTETAYLPSFDITVNGVKVENEYREYPFFVYKGITYIPITYYDSRFLGLEASWENDENRLYIVKSDITCAYRDYKTDIKNSSTLYPEVCNFKITVNTHYAIEIDNKNEEYPLMQYRGVTYFPLTWKFAKDTFGWEYSFNEGEGLSISSDNPKVQELSLPKRTGDVAFDGSYYYYSVREGEDNYIYSAFHETPEDAYIVHHLPRTNLSRNGASFINSFDGVYINYTAGSSPVMSSQYFFRLNGRLKIAVNEYPDSSRYGNHGRSDMAVRNGEISVTACNPYFDSATVFNYTKNGESFQVPALPGRIQVGAYRDGKSVNIAMDKCIKIFSDKIYFTAFDYEKPSETRSSDLYVIDTETNESKKLLENVCGFHVYNGWSNEHKADSTMILFDTNGVTMRYTELDGEIRNVDRHFENIDTEGMILKSAVGDYFIYAVFQDINGKNTVVRTYGGYAQGVGGMFDNTILKTDTPMDFFVSDEKLVVSTISESPNDRIRLAVLGGGVRFFSSDLPQSVFVHKDVLIYTLGDKAVRVDLKP